MNLLAIIRLLRDRGFYCFEGFTEPDDNSLELQFAMNADLTGTSLFVSVDLVDGSIELWYDLSGESHVEWTAVDEAGLTRFITDTFPVAKGNRHEP